MNSRLIFKIVYVTLFVTNETHLCVTKPNVLIKQKITFIIMHQVRYIVEQFSAKILLTYIVVKQLMGVIRCATRFRFQFYIWDFGLQTRKTTFLSETLVSC